MFPAPDQHPSRSLTVSNENGITSITSIESRHDPKGALYAQACARARGDVSRFVTRFPSQRVIDVEASRPAVVKPASPIRKRVLIGGGAVCWLGLLPLGAYTAAQLGALAAAVIAVATGLAFLVCIFPLRFLAVIAAAVMLPLHLITGSGHACPGVHCPGCVAG